MQVSRILVSLVGAAGVVLFVEVTTAGETPALGSTRITQAAVAGGELSRARMRREGRRIFTTPFNILDGLGDGPLAAGRPTLQANGMFLRVNGLDAQSCLECHSILSNRTIPARFAVGGAGGVSTNAIAGPTEIDVDDSEENGFAAFNGRFINPPFVFGAGGVELLAKEMTTELQALAAAAEASPDTVVPLVTKGVDFGTIVFEEDAFNTSAVEGIASDLVVRPFGRKGAFATIRAFDIGAMQFHFGMQPTEIVGEDVDEDGDGVANEILTGELSVLHVFEAALERPRQARTDAEARSGSTTFGAIGCADCHIPELRTTRRRLTLSFPEIETDPSANVFVSLDLSHAPAKFRRVSGGGLRVQLFADLKRHDMGPALAESAGDDLDPHFTTARLWGVADSAPYLHDGRASTLTEAILLHGGEAEAARDAFDGLDESAQDAVLAFLRTLRTPRTVRGR